MRVREKVSKHGWCWNFIGDGNGYEIMCERGGGKRESKMLERGKIRGDAGKRDE